MFFINPISNKIGVFEIYKWLYFVLIYILHSIPLFLELGLYLDNFSYAGEEINKSFFMHLHLCQTELRNYKHNFDLVPFYTVWLNSINITKSNSISFNRGNLNISSDEWCAARTQMMPMYHIKASAHFSTI